MERDLNLKKLTELQAICAELGVKKKGRKKELIERILESERGPVNKCVICGRDLGRQNPRQYCEKTSCPFEAFSDEEIKDIQSFVAPADNHSNTDAELAKIMQEEFQSEPAQRFV